VCGPEEGHCEKRYEIQGGGQEMALMVKDLATESSLLKFLPLAYHHSDFLMEIHLNCHFTSISEMIC